MKQIIAKHTFNANVAAATQSMSVSGDAGFGSFPLASNGGAPAATHPVAIAGTFRNLVVLAQRTHPAFTLTLFVNGSASLLSAALAGSDLTGRDVTHDVHVDAGDDVRFVLVGSSQSSPGYDVPFCLEFEGDVANQSFYAIPASFGFVSTGQGLLGGILGNGVFTGVSHFTPVLSSSYSIVSAVGTITRLDLTAYAEAPGAGVWTAYLVLNTVLQDGTGGTVDTHIAITGATVHDFSAFSLPVVPGDHLEVFVLRGGGDTPHSAVQVGCAVAFVAAEDGQFMLCGGQRAPSSFTVPFWTWTGTSTASGAPFSEPANEVPFGPTPVTYQGLYAEYGVAPGTGRSWTTTLRKNAADTAITFVVAGSSASKGSVLADIAFADGDVTAILISPFGDPNVNRFHWGFVLSTAVAPPPPPPPDEPPPHTCECCIMTELDTINEALLKIGVSQTIASLDEASREAFTGTFFFPRALNEVLRRFPWAFATKYATAVGATPGDPMELVAGTADAPVNGDWTYAYRYPSDCLLARRIVNPLVGGSHAGGRGGRTFDPHPIPFRVGRTWIGSGAPDFWSSSGPDFLLVYSNQVDAELEYTALVPCAEDFGDALFLDTLSWLLGAKMAPSLSRIDKIAQTCLAMYEGTFDTAAAVSAREQQQEPPGEAEWIRNR